MKRLLCALVVSASIALASAGCGNSVDAVPAPTPTPTPSGTATPTPTGTPTGDLSGTYNVTTPVPTQNCASPDGNVALTFNVPNVDITVSGSDFTPDWGFVPGGSLSLPDPEHGTISGVDFVANYTYCDFDGIRTTKHIATWTGYFNEDGSFESNLHQKLLNAPGENLGDCGVGESDGSVTTDMQACTDPGVTWQIHGEPQ